MERSNETWLAQLRGEDPVRQTALSDLRKKLMRGLRRALSSSADEGLLEDAVQDSLIRILERLSQFEGRSRFVTWATSIAIRVAISELRHRRWKDVSLEALLERPGSTAPFTVENGLEAVAVREQQTILDTMHELIRNALTEKQRTALLAELKGMPQDEIARRLNSNRNAIYKLTHDARKRLRRALEAAGYQAADVQTAFDM